MVDAANETAPEEGGTKDASLGILFVHGIGNQQQGETLIAFGEPLQRWIGDLLRRNVDQVDRYAADGMTARLRPPLLEPHETAHGTVLIGKAKQDKVDAEHWLMAESWWGPQVLPPAIGAFTLWLLTRGPWVLLLHFEQLRRVAFVRLEQRRATRRWRSKGAAAARAVWTLLLFLLWPLLSLLATLVVAATALLGLVPVPTFRRWVTGWLQAVSGVLGDSYVLLLNPLQAVAFSTVVAHDAAWLRTRCERVAVVAHSQGAAVAMRALGMDECPKVDMLITVGAGITKLEALREFEKRSASDRVGAMLGPVLLALSLFIWRRADGLPPSEFLTWAPMLPASLGAGLTLVAWLTASEVLNGLKKRAACPRTELRWWDIVSTHDPVPAGNVAHFFDEPRIRSVRLSVVGSIIGDHTSYWRVGGAFLPMLFRTLLRCGGSSLNVDPVMLRRVGRMWRQHARHVRLWSVTSAAHVLALMLPFVFARDRLEAFTTQLRCSAGLIPKADVEVSCGALNGQGGLADAMARLLPLDWLPNWLAINLGALAVGAALLLLAWNRICFEVWQVWADSRAAESFAALQQSPRGTERADEKVSRELARVLGDAIVYAGLWSLFLLPLVLSATLAWWPAGLVEVNAYKAIGFGGITVFGLAFAPGLLSAAIKHVIELLTWLAERKTNKAFGEELRKGLLTAVFLTGVLLFVAGGEFGWGRALLWGLILSSGAAVLWLVDFNGKLLLQSRGGGAFALRDFGRLALPVWAGGSVVAIALSLPGERPPVASVVVVFFGIATVVALVQALRLVRRQRPKA